MQFVIGDSLKDVLSSQQKYVYSELEKAGIEYDVFLHTWYTNKNLGHPLEKRIDAQSMFLKTIDFSKYYYQGEREWVPQLILNHLCLESGNKYDYIMFLRPDALIPKRFPAEDIQDFSDNTIIITNFNHWEGWNDQFAILRPDAVIPYSHRIDNIAEFRKTNGRIVSEKYVKFVVDKHYIPKQIDRPVTT